MMEQPTQGINQASRAGDAEDLVCDWFQDETCRAGGNDRANQAGEVDDTCVRFRDGVNITDAEDAMYAGFRRGVNLGERSSNALGPVDQRKPKMILPLFCGKAKWGSFWMQFQRIARRYAWDEESVMDRLVCSLRDEALTFFSEMPDYVQNNLESVTHHLSRRFDEHLPPEAYRMSLRSAHCGRNEQLEEYAARIRRLVYKGYPGSEAKLRETLNVEYFVGGLSDTDMIYEVLTKKPQTVDEAVDLVRWHTCCRDVQNRRRFMGATLADGEEAKIRRSVKEEYVAEQRVVPKDYVDRSNWMKTAECFYCHDVGHIRRNCPERKVVSQK